MNKQSKTTSTLPSKADILAFIGERPGKVGTREIARAFGLKNAMRAELKRMLRDLSDEGSLERRHKKLHHPGTLPSTVLADVTARDSDGELIATPDEWDEDAHGPAPKIRIDIPRKARPGEAAGLGDRVLLRVEETEEDDGIRHRGRIIKIIDHPKHRVLGIFRKSPHGGGRLEPVDKKMLGKELAIPAGSTAQAEDGDLVAVETSRAPRLGLTTGRIVERLGSLASERAVSLIAIHAHSIPHVFRRDTLQEAEAAKPATLAGREDWRRRAAGHHRSARRQGPRRRRARRAGYRAKQSRRFHHQCRHRRRRPLRDAGFGARSRSLGARQFGLFPRPRGADAARAHFQRSVLAAPARGPRRARRAHGHRRRRTQALAHVSSRDDALGGEAFLPASPTRDRRAAPTKITATLVKPVLTPLYAAYEALKRARDERQPLDLDLPERKILLKSDGTVDRVIMPERLEAHRLIEEFMILANVAAAETLEKARVPLIYRVHDEPAMEKIDGAARIPANARHQFPESRRIAPGSVQPHPGAGEGPRRRAARQ